MKTIVTLCICFLALAVSAQTVTVTFPGGANSAKSYQVMIDGVNYYSANSVSTNGRYSTTINNLSEGSHNLEVHTATRRNIDYSDGSMTRPSTKPVYKKTFQLRDGYDMNITIRSNGQVSFTEKMIENTVSASGQTPMSTTAFSTLKKTITAKRYQSERLLLVKKALSKNATYYTTSQVRELILLVTSEPRRLELAKLSYLKVTDPDNFSELYDVLRSEANRDALDDYVVDHGGEAEETETIENSQNTTGYSTPLSNADFNILVNRVRNNSYQSGRISEIRMALENNNYYSVPQIRELLTLVSAESDRLSLAKMGYSRVVDRTSYNTLVDLFYQQSIRTEFNNFIISNGGVVINPNTSTVQPMSDASYMRIYNQARGHFFQKNTVADIQTFFSTTTNNFSTEQVKALLQLVISEPSRLELAKMGYDRTVDPVNYSSLIELFTVLSYRTDLENFIRNKQ